MTALTLHHLPHLGQRALLREEPGKLLAQQFLLLPETKIHACLRGHGSGPADTCILAAGTGSVGHSRPRRCPTATPGHERQREVARDRGSAYFPSSRSR